jgi:hypothetical protein
MDELPDRLEKLLQAFTDEWPALLDGELVGIYIYGSLTQAAFDPARSDVDMIAATRRPPGTQLGTTIQKWLTRQASANEWTRRLQLMVVASADVFTADAPAFHYQFGKCSLGRTDGNPIPWINIIESGVTLCGPPARTFVPAVTQAVLHETLLREIGYIRDELGKGRESEWRDKPKYRAYAVLTVCRILYSHTSGSIVSKPAAAEWAMEKLDPSWHGLISAALAHDAGRSFSLPLRELRRFVGFAETSLYLVP